MSSPLCLDASVLVKPFLPEPGRPEARVLLDRAVGDGGTLVAPAFMLTEALSALRKHLYRGEITLEQAERGVRLLLALPVEEIGGGETYQRAWEIARELDMPTVYDAVYLAAAEAAGAAFWTADRKLYDRARVKPYVHLLGEEGAGGPR